MATRAQTTEEAVAERSREEAQTKINAAEAAARHSREVQAVFDRLDSLRSAVLEAQTDPDLPEDRLTDVLTDYKGQFLVAVSDLRALRYKTEDQGESDPVLPVGLRDLPLTGHAEGDGLDDLLRRRPVNPGSFSDGDLSVPVAA
jgi:hypothetical protein